MSMKKLYAAMAALAAISVVGTAVLIVFMPDTVPAHYNFAGEIDRWGSKYENFAFPAIAVLIGALIMFLAKNPNDAVPKKALLWTGICSLLLIDVMGFYFMLKGFSAAQETSTNVADNVIKLTNIGVGTMLIILGNLMPKVKRNGLFGLRTSWSMENDEIWNRSQRFGGKAAVICGFATVLMTVLVPWEWCIAVLIVFTMAFVVASVTASRKYYNEYMEKNKNI